MAGFVTTDGVFVDAGGAMVALPATGERLAEWAAAVWPDVCPECGGTVCDCITPEGMAAALERIDADPHGVNDLTGIDIPF